MVALVLLLWSIFKSYEGFLRLIEEEGNGSYFLSSFILR